MSTIDSNNDCELFLKQIREKLLAANIPDDSIGTIINEETDIFESGYNCNADQNKTLDNVAGDKARSIRLSIAKLITKYKSIVRNETIAKLEKNIPQELKDIPAFHNSGTSFHHKLPLSPATLKGFKTYPEDVASFDVALNNITEGKCSFIGIRLHDSNPFVVFDFDHALDSEGNFVSPKAKEIFESLPRTYTELSMSGSGLHIVYFMPPELKKSFKATYDQIPVDNGTKIDILLDRHSLILTADLFKDFPSSIATIDSDSFQSILDNILPHSDFSSGGSSEMSQGNKDAVNRMRENDNDDDDITTDGNVQKIIDNCNLIANLVKNPANLNFESMKLLATVFLKTKNGRDFMIDLVRNWKGDKFDLDTTSKQLDGLAKLKPSGCQKLRDCAYSDLCENCPYKDKKKFSPIMLLNPLKLKTIGNYIDVADPAVASLFVPKTFAISDSGVVILREKTVFGFPTIVEIPMLGNVVWISKIFFSVNTLTKNFEISFIDKFKNVQSFITSSVNISDSKLVTKTLTEHGIAITSNSAKDVIEYFFDFEQVNPQISCVPTISKTGWYKDKFLIPSIESKIKVAGGNHTDSIEVAGDKAELVDVMKRAWKYPAFKVAVATVLAAPCLKKIGCRNFLVNIQGRSLGGKTTAVRLASAIIGNYHYGNSLKSTVNGVEALLAQHNDLCTILDEYKSLAGTQEKRREKMGDIVFMHGNGEGKIAMNRDRSARPVLTWRGTILMTAEESILNESDLGGNFTRTLELSFNPALGSYDFESNTTTLDSDLCREIDRVVKRSYGHIFVDFVHYLENESDDACRKEFESYVDKVRRDCYGRNITSHDEYLGAFVFTIKRFLMLVFNYPEDLALAGAWEFVTSLYDQLQTKESASDSERAKSYIIDMFKAHEKGFIEEHAEAKDIPNEIWGWKKGDFPYWNPTMLDNALRKGGFNPLKIKREWELEGVIGTSITNGRKQYSAIVKFEGKSTRAVTLDFMDTESSENTSNKPHDDGGGIPPEQLPY